MSACAEYKIEAIGDLLTVPPEKWDGLLADLRVWMQLRSDMLRDFGPLIEAGLMEVPPYMRWVDDGMTGLRSLNITFDMAEPQP